MLVMGGTQLSEKIAVRFLQRASYRLELALQPLSQSFANLLWFC